MPNLLTHNCLRQKLGTTTANLLPEEKRWESLENRALQKKATQNRRCWSQPICDCFSLEESLQGNLYSLMPYRLCDRASLQHLVFLCWSYHVNTLLLGILQTTDAGEKNWNLQKSISRKWNYIARIYDENLSRQRALQDTTLKIFPPSLLFSKDLCLCCRSSKIL